MTAQTLSPRRFDLRALPIALKLAAGLALVLTVSGFITDRLIRQVVRDSQEQIVLNDLEALSQSQAFRTVDALGEQVITLNRFGANPDLQEALRSILRIEAITAPRQTLYLDALIQRQVEDFRRTRGEFDAVALIDRNGYVVGIDPAPPDTLLVEPGGWAWFDSAYNEGLGRTYIHDPQSDQLTGLTGIHIATPIYDSLVPDSVLGIMYAVWNMSNVLDDIVNVGGGRESVILEPGGTVLLSPDEPRGTVIPAALAEQLNAGESGSFIYTDMQGRDWLYGYVTLDSLGLGEASVANLRWIAIVRQPAATLQASTALLANRILIAIGASALLVTFVIALLASSMLRPLRRLTAVAARLERGDLATPIPELPADEVGRLASVLRGLVNRLMERLHELRTAVQVSHATLLTFDVTQMLGDVARALTGQFGYPDVRIYLTDPDAKRATIQAASGGEGERLLRSGHRLPVDETSLVGRAILLGEPQVGAERQQLRQAGLMTGRSELVLPLQSGGRVLGAIHILARRLGEFAPEDVDILRLIADQLSASIANARLFEQSRANLLEIEALNRRLTRQAWEEFVGTSGPVRHTLDPQENWPTPPEALLQRSEVRAESYIDADGRAVLSAPLILRGEVVGSLSVTRPAGERWSQDEVALLESVAARMAVIAEGIRLVDETSRRALREQQVNEVSASLLQRATDVESVLRTALAKLSGALGSDRIALRLGPAPADAERLPSPSGMDGREAAEGSPGDAGEADRGERRSRR